MGTKAMQEGIVASMGSAGTIRDALKKAVELNPRDFDARFSLLEYYVMAPFIVGGGIGKAEKLAKDTASTNAAGSAVMSAYIDANQGRLDKAEAKALAVKPDMDADVLKHHEALLLSIGARHMMGKKFADAQRVLADAQKRYPDSDSIHYFVARLHQEQGQHRAALLKLEQVLVKMPRPYVHYRIGKSLQALGEKAKAIAAYETAMSLKGKLPGSLHADAVEQLKALKG
jgi:tetratricopeptide (TPR) repeat protein